MDNDELAISDYNQNDNLLELMDLLSDEENDEDDVEEDVIGELRLVLLFFLIPMKGIFQDYQIPFFNISKIKIQFTIYKITKYNYIQFEFKEKSF